MLILDPESECGPKCLPVVDSGHLAWKCVRLPFFFLNLYDGQTFP